MLRYMNDDANMFESGAEALINTVNCVGVMGGGIAYQFKMRYPLMYQDYRAKCELKLLKPGGVYVYALDEDKYTPRFIFNVATKDNPRNPSEYVWVEEACMNLRKLVEYRKIESVALPALGCGLGGLDFKKVLPFYENFLGPSKCEFEVYFPK